MMILHHNVKVTYLKSIDFLRRKECHQLLKSKKAFLEIQRLTDILFTYGTTISETSCHAFDYEKFLIKI